MNNQQIISFKDLNLFVYLHRFNESYSVHMILINVCFVVLHIITNLATLLTEIFLAQGEANKTKIMTKLQVKA